MIEKRHATVLETVKLSAPGHYVLTFDAGQKMASAVKPGQFLGVAMDTGGMQFLRRPFSFYSADPETGHASILFSVYGATTAQMARLAPGETLDILGPLGGRAFTPDTRPGAHQVMVGGGYGVPPLAFLARRLLTADPDSSVTLINGARTAEFLVGTEGLETLGIHLREATNDGSRGTQGLVTLILQEILEARAEHVPIHIYTCGPTPMMRAVAEMAMRYEVPCQVSMEVFMPCGVGICMGCAVERTDQTFARGCTDGPVFEAREVAWK
ncbi:MAG: dihydroorotate dehydrogenase electron transfer subunit [Cytophagales bacterium]|nr:dihydroorotate dehydrogenase electron transfer subunit [Armatimonadota bacterium]